MCVHVCMCTYKIAFGVDVCTCIHMCMYRHVHVAPSQAYFQFFNVTSWEMGLGMRLHVCMRVCLCMSLCVQVCVLYICVYKS